MSIQSTSDESPFDVANMSSQTKQLASVLVNTLDTNEDITLSRGMLEACAVYLVSQTNNDTVDMEMVRDTLNTSNGGEVTLDDIRHTAVSLIDEHDLPISPPLEALVENIVTETGLDSEDGFDVDTAISTAETAYETTSRSPLVSAATAVYLTAKNANLSLGKQEQVATAAGTTTVSIRNALNDLRDQTNIPIDIPNTKSTTEADDIIPIYNAIHSYVSAEGVVLPENMLERGHQTIYDNWTDHLSRCSPSLTAGMFYMTMVDSDDSVSTNGIGILDMVANSADLSENSLYHRYNNESDDIVIA